MPESLKQAAKNNETLAFGGGIKTISPNVRLTQEWLLQCPLTIVLPLLREFQRPYILFFKTKLVYF